MFCCCEGMVKRIPDIHFFDGVCLGYALGKHPQEKFEKGHAWRASSPLEIVHSDLLEPFPNPSMSQDKYVLLFTDDCMRFTWVYFLKQKYEVFSHLKVFKAHVEKQYGKMIKILRTNNGGEFVNKDIQHLCDEAGIEFQHTIPYTPQQNGVAERKNRSLKEMANFMLHARSFPPRLWDKEINYACYIRSISPHKYVKGKNPFEAWSGMQPKVTHFCIFGSHTWSHIPSEKRKALEPQSTTWFFVGYPKDVKGYQLLDLSTYKLSIERSVYFEESPPQASLEQQAEAFVLLIMANLRDDDSYHWDQNSYLIFDADLENDEPTCEDPASRPKWAQSTIQATWNLAGDPMDLRRTLS